MAIKTLRPKKNGKPQSNVSLAFGPARSLKAKNPGLLENSASALATLKFTEALPLVPCNVAERICVAPGQKKSGLLQAGIPGFPKYSAFEPESIKLLPYEVLFKTVVNTPLVGFTRITCALPMALLPCVPMPNISEPVTVRAPPGATEGRSMTTPLLFWVNSVTGFCNCCARLAGVAWQLDT